MDVLVIGSFMMDHIVITDRIPLKGETFIGNDFFLAPGGKGVNQAVAAAKLGAKVGMAGKLGDDVNGKEFLNILEKNKVDYSNVILDSIDHTGVGIVMSEKDGDNRIIIVQGANLKYNLENLIEIEEYIIQSKLILLQLEIDLDVVYKVIDIANKNNIPVILNPAPGHAIKDDVLKKIQYLTPNETELEIISGEKVNSIDSAFRAARKLLEKGVSNVIVTLGEKGVIVVNENEEYKIDAKTVDVVDTIGAGASFNGALAYKLTSGSDLRKAVEFANTVAALTVTKRGAIPSLPAIEDVLQFHE